MKFILRNHKLSRVIGLNSYIEKTTIYFEKEIPRNTQKNYSKNISIGIISHIK